ncbi:extracellular solute-binding protein [Actinacidiphila acidipaludis]|uniref:Extracellular solute-binding protein n=1 Tax=Actinacidiphila acidipaludis TaxID=2873382 RepID=A0ABS7Q6V5_9ACTN|nr:extracellular solute-binding protein [Streptomyces acidipaludis]MBY8878876.1 extracellular solute-binding protein [Streptomyces acidipaludis]
MGAASVLAATTLSACGGSSPLSKDVTLHMVAADYGDPKTHNSSTKYWDDVVAAFEKQNSHIKVDVQVLSWDVVDDKVAQMVKAGHAPDIAQIGSYAAYASAGQLYSADDLFTVSEQSDFLPALADAGSVNRVQYGIPWVSSSRMFFYNKHLFEQAGITKAPKSWDDVEKDAKLLKANGVKDPYGLPLGTEEAQAESLLWMLGDDGGFTDSVGSYTFDSAANIETFQWLKTHLVQPGLVQASAPGKTNRRDVFADFLSGKAGMIMGHPTLLAQAKAAHIDVGVAPLPGRTGPSSDTLGVADWMMAFKQNGNKDASGKFLQFVYQEKNAVKFLDEYGLLPVTTTALTTMKNDPKYADLRKFLDLLPEAVFYPVNKTSWGPVSDAVKADIGKAVTGDPKTVLSKLQVTAQGLDNAQKS